MYDTESVTVRLNRFFNLFNPSVYKWWILTHGIVLLWGIYLICSERSVTKMIIIVVLLNAITLPNMLLHCPKTLTLSENNVAFEDYINMKPRYRRVSGFCWLKVSYSVSEIKDVEFHQNAIEKIFDVGHIHFSGKATFTAKRDVDRIKEKDMFVIYGIKDFFSFSNQFLRQ